MGVQLDHVAINSSNVEETVRFFSDVFCMSVSRETGVKPHRRIWFHQGIQINETTELSLGNTLYHHIALRVSDKERVVEAAKSYGCSLVDGKSDWLLTGDGIVIELMA